MAKPAWVSIDEAQVTTRVLLEELEQVKLRLKAGEGSQEVLEQMQGLIRKAWLVSDCIGKASDRVTADD